jgi:hypothetical protein
MEAHGLEENKSLLGFLAKDGKIDPMIAESIVSAYKPHMTGN